MSATEQIPKLHPIYKFVVESKPFEKPIGILESIVVALTPDGKLRQYEAQDDYLSVLPDSLCKDLLSGKYRFQQMAEGLNGYQFFEVYRQPDAQHKSA